MAVVDLQFGIVNRGLIGTHRPFELVRGRFLRIHLLLRYGARLFQQTLESLIIQLCVPKLRLIAIQSRLRLR